MTTLGQLTSAGIPYSIIGSAMLEQPLGSPAEIRAACLALIEQNDDAHATCSLTACLNPLHPGPCKGWKHTLHAVSPAAWHALEAARVEKANKKRLAKIEELKSKGLPIPKKLLVPIEPKPAPVAVAAGKVGQHAKAAGGEAHTLGQAINQAAGITPGKVTLGQAIKAVPKPSTEKGPKGKKQTLASKGIAFVISQEKVTDAYKLNKAAGITPEQWDALSPADQGIVRAELKKIQENGFGPQQKQAAELLDKLAPTPKKPGLAKTGGPAAKAIPTPGHRNPYTPAMVQAAKYRLAAGSSLHGDGPATRLTNYDKLTKDEFDKLDPKEQKFVLDDIKKNFKTHSGATAGWDGKASQVLAKLTGKPQAEEPKPAEPKFVTTPSGQKIQDVTATQLGKKTGTLTDQVLFPEKYYNPKQQAMLDAAGKAGVTADQLKAMTSTKGDFSGLSPEHQKAVLAKLDDIAHNAPEPAVAATAQLLLDAHQGEAGKLPQGALKAIAVATALKSSGGGLLGDIKALNAVSAEEFQNLKKPYRDAIEAKRNEFMGKMPFAPELEELGKKIKGEKPQPIKLSTAVPEPMVKAHTLAEAVKPAPEAGGVPKHVQHAVDMANGTAPGASWSKSHLAAYQELSKQEFDGLDPAVKQKIIAELEKGKTKFLDPKKKAQAQNLIDTFQAKPASEIKNEVQKDLASAKSVTAVPDMTDAQITSRVKELLGEKAASTTMFLTFDEMKQADQAAQVRVDQAMANVADAVKTNPKVASAAKNLLGALRTQEQAKIMNAKVEAHLNDHHVKAIISGKDVNGNPLSTHDRDVLSAHAEKLREHAKQFGNQDQANKDVAEKAASLLQVITKVQAQASAPKPASAPEVGGTVPGTALSDFDANIIDKAYQVGWAGAARDAVWYGAKSNWSAKQAIKDHPDRPAFSEDFDRAVVLAGKAAVARAHAHQAELAVPLDENGELDIHSPEYQAMAKAQLAADAARKEFNDLLKQAQAKLDKIRADAGLKKRALPKLDAVAVKTAAAEKAFYETGTYGAPLYGKKASAKQFLLAKVGPKLAVPHKDYADKYEEKLKKESDKAAKLQEEHAAFYAAQAAAKEANQGKYALPSHLATTENQQTPNAAVAEHFGFHLAPSVASSGPGWDSAVSGSAYVSSPEDLDELNKHISDPSTSHGMEAQKKFLWSINNMTEKGAEVPGIAGYKSALYSYTGNGFVDVNNALNSIPPGAKSSSATVTKIDKAMAASPPLEHDVVLYRGFHGPKTVFGKSGKWNDTNVAGMEWTQRSYSSTSGSLSTAQSFGSGGVVMRIIIPKEMGVHGINAKGGQHPGENEIILQRGLRYRVIADHGLGKGEYGYTKTRYIDVMVVPNPHAKPE